VIQLDKKVGLMSIARFVLILCALKIPLFLGSPLAAQTESPNSTFKRIKVGDKKTGPLINIQIDPEEQALALAPSEDSDDANLTEDQLDVAKPKANLQGWFWDVIGVSMTQASPDRMEDAVLQMRDAPDGFYVPRAEHLNSIARDYGSQILMASIGTKVSPAFVLAVIGVESAGKADATSSAGARGLMQLIPATAERFGVQDITDPAQNIAGGVAYLDWLMGEFGGDPLLALAAYNAGENAVKKNAGIPDYAETRAYVPKVVAAWQVARNLCATPPLLVSEPCVFRIQALGAPK